ncbi:MAG: protein-disulfide reductase DsbD [Campylobacter sp.]|nr:protein-disulfide reductase DsbD [Campylobacter sp.]
MRIIYLLLFFLTLSFSKILSLNEAFKIDTFSNDTAIILELKIADEVYVYDDKIKLLLNNQNLIPFISYKEAVLRQNEKVHYDELKFILPYSLLSQYLKDKNFLEFQYQGCSNEGFCYQPQKINFELEKQGEIFTLKRLEKDNLSKKSQENIIANFLAKENLTFILLSFFGYGLLLSLTPCSLPMIPILSSLILAKGGNKNSKIHNLFLSFVYIFFMSLAYAIAGVIASYLGASVQGYLQKTWVIVLFALIFIFFALAMFDVIKFELPLKIQNFISQKSHKGKGILSIAIMGFLSALIIGPCVAAPLAGALLYIADSKDILLGGLALFIMSLGMGIPLLFVGFGIGFLKPGIWMQKIKILFGFVMLAMTIWILSRILETRIILCLYGILGVFFSVFMGLFDKTLNILEKFKKAFLILILSYSLCLFLGGIFGAKDFLNPLNFSTQKQENEDLTFTTLSNLNEIQRQIKQNKQKIMLDFTASWCENCKFLDETTFKDERVIEELKNYKLIKVDLTEINEEQRKIMKEFQIFGPPVLIFFDKGKEMIRFTGFIGAEEFLKNLEQSLLK